MCQHEECREKALVRLWFIAPLLSRVDIERVRMHITTKDVPCKMVEA